MVAASKMKQDVGRL